MKSQILFFPFLFLFSCFSQPNLKEIWLSNWNERLENFEDPVYANPFGLEKANTELPVGFRDLKWGDDLETVREKLGPEAKFKKDEGNENISILEVFNKENGFHESYFIYENSGDFSKVVVKFSGQEKVLNVSRELVSKYGSLPSENIEEDKKQGNYLVSTYKWIDENTLIELRLSKATYGRGTIRAELGYYSKNRFLSSWKYELNQFLGRYAFFWAYQGYVEGNITFGMSLSEVVDHDENNEQSLEWNEFENSGAGNRTLYFQSLLGFQLFRYFDEEDKLAAISTELAGKDYDIAYKTLSKLNAIFGEGVDTTVEFNNGSKKLIKRMDWNPQQGILVRFEVLEYHRGNGTFPATFVIFGKEEFLQNHDPLLQSANGSSFDL